MPVAAANAILIAALAYVTIGVAFGVPFVVRGVGTVDHAAAGSGWSFRLLILPGVVAFWPVMLFKWMRARREGTP